MRRLPTTPDERGFSLMEALTVIGIMTIILVMVTQIFAVSYDVYVKQSARAENETGAILAARTLTDMTRGADSVLASKVIAGTTYTTSASVVVLRIPTVNTAGAVVAGTYDSVAVYRDATNTGEIWSDTESGAGSRRTAGKKRLTSGNLIMTFRYDAEDVTKANRVQAYLVNQRTARSTVVTTKGWTAIFLRNN